MFVQFLWSCSFFTSFQSIHLDFQRVVFVPFFFFFLRYLFCLFWLLLFVFTFLLACLHFSYLICFLRKVAAFFLLTIQRNVPSLKLLFFALLLALFWHSQVPRIEKMVIMVKKTNNGKKIQTIDSFLFCSWSSLKYFSKSLFCFSLDFGSFFLYLSSCNFLIIYLLLSFFFFSFFLFFSSFFCFCFCFCFSLLFLFLCLFWS